MRVVYKMADPTEPTTAYGYSNAGISDSINSMVQAVDTLIGSIFSIPTIGIKSVMLAFAWVAPIVQILDQVLGSFTRF